MIPKIGPLNDSGSKSQGCKKVHLPVHVNKSVLLLLKVNIIHAMVLLSGMYNSAECAHRHMYVRLTTGLWSYRRRAANKPFSIW